MGTTGVRDRHCSTLESLANPGEIATRTLVVVAHPDDELIGLGARLHRMPNAVVVHVTDGAPLDRTLSDPEHDPERLLYRERRAKELDAVLTRQGVGPERRVALDVVDQQAVFALERIARAVAELIDARRPELVLTQPYEGGHPDHDATAFAVHAAARLARHRPAMAEMASYSAVDGGFVTERFVDDTDSLACPLDADERARKDELRRMYASQAGILGLFPFAVERFRLAPAYDFSRPPHAGTLHYEKQGWDLDGARWRQHAFAAARALGLGDPPWR